VLSFGRNEIRFIHGPRKAAVDALMAAGLVRRNRALLPEALRSWRRLARDRRLTYTANNKYVLFNNRVFVDCFAPRWPGRSFDRLTDHALRLVVRGPGGSRFLPYLVISITKKCPFRCEHCYAIDSLGARDVVTRAQLLGVVRQMQRRGLGVVAWEGGEPLLRFDDLLALIRETHRESEAWLATTGWGLTAERARLLREAGLVAAIISLDHHDPDRHNAFRRNPRAFDAAVRAARTFREHGVLPSLCICATRDNIRDDSLHRYLELAREIGVGFVQVLDATPSGNYLGQDVLLTRAEVERLKRFHVEVNTAPRYRDYPAVSARALVEADEHFGCCACNGLCYIDSSGNLQACDLLQVAFGNVIEEGFDAVYERMRRSFPDFTRGRCPAQTLHREIARAHRGSGGKLPLDHERCPEVLERLRARPRRSELRARP
jgi:MoaA/NifB/PqqE/SkfB family radical SAM enzyme